MHFFRSTWFMRNVSILSAAAAIAACTASAQFAHTPDFSSATAPSANESSSAAGPALGADGTDGLAALPSAPAAGGAGQPGGYDTQSQSFFSRMAWEAGGGFNAPAGNSANDITWGGNFTLGAGYHFDRRVSALIEYQFIHDKLPGRLINQVGATGGYATIWSFTIDPVFDLFPKSTNDIYVVGGGGFYRKVTNFTDPVPTLFCTYFYCGVGFANAVVGHFSSNQGGWSIGGGYQHRFGGIYGDSRMKLFAEARYLDVLTPATITSPNGLGIAAVGADTKLVPVTFGVRW